MDQTALPSELQTVFESIRSYLDQTLRLGLVAQAGIQEIAGAEELADVMKSIDERQLLRDWSHSPEVDERMRKLAAWAKEEVSSGFQLTLAHSLVGVWGAMEAWAHDAAVEWLLRDPNSLTVDIRLRLRASDVISQDVRMRTHSVVQTAADSIAAKADHRVEALLESVALVPLQMDGAAFGLVAKMAQVRHLIAHRAGRADRKYCRRFPDDGVVPGDLVPITIDGWIDFIEACYNYVDAVKDDALARIAAEG